MLHKATEILARGSDPGLRLQPSNDLVKVYLVYLSRPRFGLHETTDFSSVASEAMLASRTCIFVWKLTLQTNI